MTEYPYPTIHTVAQIIVTAGDTIRKFGWGPARVRKEQAAAWFRAQPGAGDMKVSWRIKQKAAEVPWREAGAWTWDGAAGPGLEYAAVSLLGVPEWGRSR